MYGYKPKRDTEQNTKFCVMVYRVYMANVYDKKNMIEKSSTKKHLFTNQNEAKKNYDLLLERFKNDSKQLVIVLFSKIGLVGTTNIIEQYQSNNIETSTGNTIKTNGQLSPLF